MIVTIDQKLSCMNVEQREVFLRDLIETSQQSIRFGCEQRRGISSAAARLRKRARRTKGLLRLSAALSLHSFDELAACVDAFIRTHRQLWRYALQTQLRSEQREAGTAQ